MPGLAVFGMPRQRVRRRIERSNADLLGDDYKFTRDPELAEQRAKSRRARRDAELERYCAQVVCGIRGCREMVPVRTHVPLSVCLDHAYQIWEMVERNDADPFFREVLATAIAKRDALRAALRDADQAETRKFFAAPDAPGEIYYVRLGGLIKVGWSSDLRARIRSYGPDAALLVHYEATRTDETNLHRNLAPSRAKGREWYHDDAIIRAFISNTLRQHGPPTLTDLGWTQPKPVVAGKRVKRTA